MYNNVIKEMTTAIINDTIKITATKKRKAVIFFSNIIKCSIFL